MKRIFVIFVLLTTLCCFNEERKASFQTTDVRLSVYKSILDELVTKHFYNLYLGADFEKLEEKFHYKRDNPDYLRELDTLRRRVNSDTLMQSAICLRHEFSAINRTQLGSESPKDSASIQAGLRQMFQQVPMDYKVVHDSLVTPQQKFLADDFKPSSYRVKTRHCSIGIISFSNIYFNKERNKGFLYYEFDCGEKCGKGEVLLIAKQDGLWTIEKWIRMWIS